MGMKKVFVGLGIGVMVATGLIQTGVVHVNGISTSANIGKLVTSSEPIGDKGNSIDVRVIVTLTNGSVVEMKMDDMEFYVGAQHNKPNKPDGG